MSRVWDRNSIVGWILHFWREYFRIPDSLQLRGRDAEDSELQYILAPKSSPDHFQNGSKHEQEYANLRRISEELQEECSRNKALIARLKEEIANSRSRIEELQIQLQGERTRYEADKAELENQLQQGNDKLSGTIEELQKQLQGECSRNKALSARLKEEIANSSNRIEELQTQLRGERTRYKIEKAELENQFQQCNDNLSGTIEEFERQLQGERHRYEQSIAELEYQLGKLKGEIAAQAEEIQKLVKQLELAERQNARDFPGGESFLDSGATPHILNKVVERVNQSSGNSTKLLMSALKNGGVDCAKVAKALAPSVFFERVAHTKYVYQALICKVLFTDFESECFNIEDNASESLDPEQPRTENFQRYQQLIALENPEDLVYDDETDNDFRRFCNKKQKDLIDTLSLTGAPGVGDVGALIFGEVFGPDGIRRLDSAGTQSQIKVASSFVKFALSVFLVHKLAFSMHPIARIFRVKDAAEFKPEYMEPVVASADSDDEDTDAVSLNVGFMVVPGFYVNRIVIHSRVYTVKKSIE